MGIARTAVTANRNGVPQNMIPIINLIPGSPCDVPQYPRLAAETATVAGRVARRRRERVPMIKDGKLTRYGQTIVAVVLLVVMGLVAAAYVFTHTPAERDSNQAIVGLLGLVSVVSIGIMNLNRGQRIEDLTHGQNETLAEIKQTAEAHPAVTALQQEMKNQRHAFNNVLQLLTSTNSALEAERNGLREQIALMERQSEKDAGIARTLAAKVEPPHDAA